MAWETLPGETPIDISGLRIKGIGTRAQLDPYEADNIRKAVVRYFGGRLSRRMAKFDLTWAKKLHYEMFGDVWAWAGRLRTSDVNLGVAWHQVETSLETLLGDLNFWDQSGMDRLEQAARLHHRAVAIHPFFNGNGRWSRMLANIWLRLHKHAVTEWPEHLIGSVSPICADYLATIQAADQGDYEPLMELHRRFTPPPG